VLGQIICPKSFKELQLPKLILLIVINQEGS
jgi:hypothetical protein